MVEDYSRSWFDNWDNYFSFECGFSIRSTSNVNGWVTSQLKHFISLLVATTPPNGFDINSTNVERFFVTVQKALDILPKILTKSSISYDVGLEFIDIYYLCLRCFDLITLELKDDPYVAIDFQRKIYIDCLRHWGLYNEVEDEYEYEKDSGGNHLLGFMFGNVDDSGNLDADYLDEDTKEHLAAVADKLGTTLADIHLSVRSFQSTSDATDQDYDEKAENAVNYEDINDQYEEPEVQPATEEEFLLPRKDLFSTPVPVSIFGNTTSVYNDENMQLQVLEVENMDPIDSSEDSMDGGSFSNSVKELLNTCVDISNASTTKISEEHAKLRQLTADLLFLTADVSGIPSPAFKAALFFYKTGLIWYDLKKFDSTNNCFEKATELVSSIEINPVSDNGERKLLLDLNIARSRASWEVSDQNVAIALLNMSKNVLFGMAGNYYALASQYLNFGKILLSKNTVSVSADALKLMNEALGLKMERSQHPKIVLIMDEVDGMYAGDGGGRDDNGMKMMNSLARDAESSIRHGENESSSRGVSASEDTIWDPGIDMGIAH